MNSNDTQYAEYYFLSEEEFRLSPKANTVEEMAEYSFNELTKE